MQSRFKAAALVAVLAALSVAITGCGQLNVLQARKSIKEAHILYAQQDWKRAAEKYEQTINYDPDQNQAYFYLANSYDNLFKPSRKGDPVNDGYLTKAVEFYHKASQVSPDPKTRTLALQYLVAAYGADKLNDPGQAEPLVQEMIRLEPTEPSNYYVLAKMYEDAGMYDRTEETLLKAKEARPNDPGVYAQLARFYNDMGDFDKTMAAHYDRVKVEPNNPEGYYTISVFFWDKVNKDFRLKEPEKRTYLSQGLEAANKALELNPNYIDALVYKGLILRSQALIEKEPSKQ
ncbi:MAG: putative system TPR-repeat lipoprotein, partial [Acidobacteria bacterium]|nr:putative system TPR-repeat lipoprotein [Acidobacteriota bacterium]